MLIDGLLDMSEMLLEMIDCKFLTIFLLQLGSTIYTEWQSLECVNVSV